MNENKTTKSMIYKTDALIEGWYAPGGSQMCVLLLPPHPGFGGKISNSILRLAHNSFFDAGFTTLRINFRGVGMSKGTPNDRSMDLQDALHCLDWLSTKHGDPKILWVAGFAYGAHIAINVAMRRPGVHGFIAITPYTEDNEFNILTPCPNGNIITGSEDQVVPPSTIKRIASELTSQKGCSIVFTELNGADHNYTDHREVLALEISRYISEMTSSETKSILVA